MSRGRKPAIIPDSVADAYRAGNPIIELAREHRTSGERIRQRLIELGVAIRQRGRQKSRYREMDSAAD